VDAKSESILFYILGSFGIVLFFLGALVLDINFELGAAAVIVGLAFILWANYEGGYFRANKK
jgi:membrane-bound ClpP family serine protease